jgi:hypothetical protein
MKKLLIKASDIPDITGTSGNIDVDSIRPSINIAQNTSVKRVLGADLYDKIVSDYTAGTLSGVYLTIYNDYVVYMLAFHTISVYLSLGVSKVANNGSYKVGVEGSINLTLNENAILGKNYQAVAISYEGMFFEFIKTVNIPEYKQACSNENNNRTNLIQLH